MGTQGKRLLAAMTMCGALLGAAPAADAAFGDAKTLAPFPAQPGFPEGVVVQGDRVYVAGAATFGTTASGPSAVLAYDRDSGDLVRRYDVAGEDLLQEHANASIARQADGDLLVLNTQLGIYELDPETGKQTAYAPTLPNLPACLPLLPKTRPCSPTLADLPPLPNDLAFGPDGELYVSDSMQATIWRVPAGGGTPTVWFQDTKLASPYIGVNGLRLSPDGERVVFTVSIDLLGRASVYALPRVAAPKAAQLQLVHRFPLGQLPDGIAFGAAGDLFVTQAGPTSSGIDVLRPDGSLKASVRGPLFDGPANLAFDGGGRALVSNHAPVTGLVLRKFSVLDVDLADAGAPLLG